MNRGDINKARSPPRMAILRVYGHFSLLDATTHPKKRQRIAPHARSACAQRCLGRGIVSHSKT